jgi:cysteine desulfurase/selenocysteine lyase
MALNLEYWRSQFPQVADRVYLNHSSECLLPVRTVKALEEAAARKASPWRMSLDDYFGVPRRCREKLAQLIGARAEEIALTTSTTYGMNVLAGAMAETLDEGDEVVLWRGVFPSDAYPWLNRERSGLKVRFEGAALRYPSADAVEEALGDNTRVLVLSWVSFTTGFRIDLDRIGRLCRDRGILFVVDGTQGVGALSLDVSSLPVDALACSGHKWLLSPTGTGFLYVRQDLQDSLPAPFAGWYPYLKEESFSSLTAYEMDSPGRAERYEVGTPPTILLAGLEASLDLLLETGTEAIEHRLRELVCVLRDALPEGWQLISPVGMDEPHASAILSTRKDGTDSQAAAKALYKAGAYGIVREGLLRLSPHVYLEEEELRRVLGALRGL